MGVKGLHRYMCQKGLEPVVQENFNFIEEIQKWKIDKGNNKRPKILVDLKEIIHAVVQRDNLGQCLGGKYSLWTHYYRKFFKQLKEANAELIFFAAGQKLTDELMVFIPKREEEYIRHLDVLDKIDATDGSMSEFQKRRNYDIRAPITMEYNMHKLAQECGELRINYVRHNQEIAKYTKQHDGTVLAVITNDNDFMVFDGDFQFWQANDINMKDLTGRRMNRQKVRARLDLNSQQLQLLSALSGSSYLPVPIMKEFYKKIWDDTVKGEGRIPQIAKYIRDEVPVLATSEKDCVRFDLKKVARDIFGDDYTEQDLNAIENGLAQYNLNFEAESSSRNLRSMQFCKSRNMFIYKLFTDDVYLIKDICYIDFRNYKSKNYAELIIPLLRKVQGIIFANEQHKPHARAICMKYAHDEPYTVVEETIEYPPMSVPDLFDLVFKSNDKHFDNSRWSLFDWIFDFGPDFTRLARALHRKYFAVLVTIKYLLQQEEITIDEADAILITEEYVRNPRPRQERGNHIETLNTHFIRLAHLYTKMYNLISHCLEVCGLFHFTDFIMFDGQHFNFTLQSITSDANKKKMALKKIEDFRVYAK